MTLAAPNKTAISPLEPSAVDRFKGNLRTRAETALDEVVFTVAPEDYRALCERLHLAGFDFPRCLSGTDMDWGLGVTLHLQSLETKHKVAVRTYVPYDRPRVQSVSDLWGGVEWHEREAYDLVGIHFDGHPDLRRILTEDHWTIHPLQRRYDTRGYLMSDWSSKPWPSPAPWEDGFTPFAPAAPAAHATPAKPAAAKPAASNAPTPAPEASAAPSQTASVPAAPPSTASSDTPAAPTEVARPAPTKERKKWELKAGSSAPAAPAASPAPPASPEAPKVEAPTAPAEDDLKRIEGIDEKINQALRGANITSFAQLASMSPDQIAGFLESAGLSHPKVETWTEQAALLARGDEAGLKALKERLAAPNDAAPSAPAAPAATGEAEKPRNPKIKRWEPKS